MTLTETVLKHAKKIVLGCALACSTLGLTAPGAYAQTPSDDTKQEIDALRRQVEMLMQKVNALSAQQTPTGIDRTPGVISPAPSATAASAQQVSQFLQRKPDGLPGTGVTLLTHGGEITFYGNLDVSIDDTTKGLGNAIGLDGTRPAGRTGWLPAISSNLSYLGVRGMQSLGTIPLRFVYQLETQIDISATSGTSETNSNTSNVVKGGLTSRNSYIGLTSPTYGALKIGKTDAPYKLSTARMNAFSGMLGDYAVIMGNTGGDNRVEFGTRLSHAVWYESPTIAGLSLNALVSPGQNRGYDNSNIAAGESDCTGGNVPGSGATPLACNDGSYGAAYSASLAYSQGPLYLTAAYEGHRGVNRSSDLAAFDTGAIANERAVKVGLQYKFPTRTTVSAIWESMQRGVPDYLQYQNERSRTGYWFALSQELSHDDTLHFGWGHANKAKGDPGQHNTNPGAGVDNAADMFTLAWKHMVDDSLSTYINYAMTNNHPYAHYDLGAGGRGVTTDCHDGSNPDTTGFDPNGGAPHCYAGGKLKGVSVGMKYTF